MDHIGLSSFNLCETWKLSLIEGSPPLKLLVDKTVRPMAVKRVSAILVNLADNVKADLDRKMTLWVIECFMPMFSIFGVLGCIYIRRNTICVG